MVGDGAMDAMGSHDVAAVEVSETKEERRRHVDIDSDEGYVDTRSVRQQWLEFVLICACNIAWTIDSAILPMFFKEFQVLFKVSQTSLSMLSTAKGWAAALCAFPCGFMSELVPRPKLVGIGVLLWAVGLAICGTATRFEVMFAGRILNGIGLGVVQPLLLSLVAAKNPPSKRGSAFGFLFFVGAFCNTIFGLVATRYAATSVAGVAGWRVSVMIVVVLSASVGLLVWRVVEEPNSSAEMAERRRTQGFCSVFVKNMPKVLQLFKYPTFVLILCQGAPGTAPWTVFPFFTQWLELSCFTHPETALIFATFGWGASCSNLISGALLNFVARRYPDHGPPSIANFSVASGIPFLVLLFFVLAKPADLGRGNSLLPTYMVTFLCFGLCAGMCGTLNKKVFADIVPPAIFTYVFAIDQLIENMVGNFAGVAVGLITDEVFDYDVDNVHEGECAPTEAKKLGKGMFAVCNVAWAICFSVYLGMHYTYPRDRRRQLDLRRKEAEAESGPVQSEGDQSSDEVASGLSSNDASPAV